MAFERKFPLCVDVYSLDLGKFIIFGVVVTTKRVATCSGKEGPEDWMRRATNCRWNNFRNVVHSLNIINDFDVVVDLCRMRGGTDDWLRKWNQERNRSRHPFPGRCMQRQNSNKDSLLISAKRRESERDRRAHVPPQAFYTQWAINACASVTASRYFASFRKLPCSGVRKQFYAMRRRERKSRKRKGNILNLQLLLFPSLSSITLPNYSILGIRSCLC